MFSVIYWLLKKIHFKLGLAMYSQLAICVRENKKHQYHLTTSHIIFQFNGKFDFKKSEKKYNTGFNLVVGRIGVKIKNNCILSMWPL